MIIRFPWLISRRKLIFNCIFEILLILLLNKFIFFDYLKFAQDIDVFTMSFIPFWLLISYIIGRYSYEDFVLKNNKFLILIKLFSLTLIASFLSLFFVFLISYNINLNNYNHFDKIILSYSTFVSFAINLIQLPIIFKLIKNSNLKEKWVFVGSKNIFNLIKKEMKWCRKNIQLIYKDFDSSFSKSEIKKVTGVFFDNLNNLDNEYFKKFILIQSKGVKFIDLKLWCENYLQRFPPEILSAEYMISGNFKKPQSSFQLRVKRIGDISFSILLLLFTSPIILISGILIYLEDRKSIFYKQERVGLNQKPFTLYKLRTMKINAEEGIPKWSAKNDNRVTKIGKILRKTRIDELPQLLCVIRGDMSLIGPRPERKVFDMKLENCIPFYNFRYTLKPGLSGWAQVNYSYGASIEDSKRKLSFDLYYLRNLSIWLDFLIFLKTLRIIFLRKGSSPLR